MIKKIIIYFLKAINYTEFNENLELILYPNGCRRKKQRGLGQQGLQFHHILTEPGLLLGLFQNSRMGKNFKKDNAVFIGNTVIAGAEKNNGVTFLFHGETLESGGKIFLDFLNRNGWAIKAMDPQHKVEYINHDQQLIKMPDWD